MKKGRPIENADHHIVYMTVNLLNGKVYIGVHSTYDLDDGYLGSGILLDRAISKNGRSSFERRILGEFESRKDALDVEAAIVDKEFVGSDDNYNVCTGGYGGSRKALRGKTIRRMIASGKYIWMEKDDPRVSNGESESVWIGTLVATEVSTGKRKRIYRDDPRLTTGEFIVYTAIKGKVGVKGENDECLLVDKDDPRFLSGELEAFVKGTFPAYDVKTGKRFRVKCGDPRLESGEIAPCARGRKYGKEKGEKWREKRLKMMHAKDKEGNVLYVRRDDERVLSGELIRWEVTTGKMMALILSTGEKERVNKGDPRFLTGEIVPFLRGVRRYKSKISGECRIMRKDDPALETGEWEVWGGCKGRKMSEDQKKKIGQAQKRIVYAIDQDGKCIRAKEDDPRFLTGELKVRRVGYRYYIDEDGKTILAKNNDPRVFLGKIKRTSGIHKISK